MHIGPAVGYPVAVAHLFELASSGRSKCRGCNQPIQRGEWRFGERLPNPFGGGEMTLWFHPLCAAYKLPQEMLEGLQDTSEAVPDREALERAVHASASSERRRRIDGAERSRSGQAACRCCREPIERGTWRIRIVYYEEGRFSPGGYIHLGCCKPYFDTDAVLDQVLQLSPALSDSGREELRQAFDSATPHPAAAKERP